MDPRADVHSRTRTQHCSFQTPSCYPPNYRVRIITHFWNGYEFGSNSKYIELHRDWNLVLCHNGYIEAICIECTYPNQDWSYSSHNINNGIIQSTSIVCYNTQDDIFIYLCKSVFTFCDVLIAYAYSGRVT